MTKHTEEAFEAHIVAEMTSLAGWAEGPVGGYDRDTALLPDELIGFVADTQPDSCELLERRMGGDWQPRTCAYIARELDKNPGRALRLLREGKEIHGVHLRLAAFKPTSGVNPELVARYEANRLTVVRQVPVRRPNGDWGAVDLGLFINGIPVASAELKNTLTGQHTRHAIDQYRYDRDSADKFLSRRCVVHFAIDPDTVAMTTRLAGATSRFLPFNRGSDPAGMHSGAGNAPYPSAAHKTAYLWRDVWQRDAWLDILQRFVHLQDDGDEMIFPRFHQWDAVLKVERHLRSRGPGTNYLIQHSAGAGKSNTIGWLGHRLSVLHDSYDKKVFEKVIVITDRRVLDQQLQDKLRQFEPKKARGAVRVINRDSSQLAAALEAPDAKIVVTTLQKFPYVLEKVGNLHGGRFAVLIDEAHSSQGGDAASDLRAVLAGKSGKEAMDAAAAADQAAEDDALYQVEQTVEAHAAARKRNPNLSMFAFTATPKAKTLELFGTPTGQPDEHSNESLRPFHVYSMRQAIEEGFIHDVLANYTTYRVFRKLATRDGDKPIDDKSKAAKAVARYVRFHPYIMDQKAEVIVEHFREQVAGRIGGKAKAMVVTSSRLHAVKSKKALDRYIGREGYDDIAALVAFSGRIIDPDVPDEDELTEAKMNGFPESETTTQFESDDYQVLVVAEKYQTGYDQPLLHTMYVDKRLTGLNAVQTLQRINRIHPEKDGTFILDFVNAPDEIQQAFEPWYQTTLATRTDPQALYETWERIQEHNVVDDDHIDEFAAIWFSASGLSDPGNHAKLYTALEPAKNAFADLNEADQDAFRKALSQYVRMYAFLSQMLDYTDTPAAKRYAYAKNLLPRIAEHRGDSLDLGDDLLLTHLRIENTGTSSISLGASIDPLSAYTGAGIGALTQQEQTTLAEIVDAINERYGLGLGDADKVFFASIGEHMSDKERLQQQAAVNTKDNFAHAFDDEYMDAVVDRLDDSTELGKRLLDDNRFSEIVRRFLLDYTYRRAQEKHARPELPIGGTV